MSAKQSETASNNNNNDSKNKEDNTILTKPKPRFPSSSSLSRRTPSVSSSSSSSSSSFSSSNSSSSFRSSSTHEISPPPSPEGGIPFSWETIPGIPKTQIPLKHTNSSKSSYLPLPPAGTPVSSSHNTKSTTQKKHRISCHRKDPFFAALVECSKSNEGDEKGAVFGRSKLGWSFALAERFGVANMSGCKNACVVADALVFIPRSPRRIPYDKVKNRAG